MALAWALLVWAGAAWAGDPAVPPPAAPAADPAPAPAAPPDDPAAPGPDAQPAADPAPASPAAGPTLLVPDPPAAATPIAGPRLPLLVRAAAAAWPPLALEQGREARVLLEVGISATGEVVDVRIAEPAGYGFDEAAIQAVRNFQFEPALDADGVPVDSLIQYRYDFKLAAVPVVSVVGEVLVAGQRMGLEAGLVFEAPDGGLLRVDSAADGSFRLAGLSPGRWRVAVAAPGFDSDAAEVDIVEGRVAELRFYLVPSLAGGAGRSDLEIVVESDRVHPEVTERALTADELRRVPGSGGDIVRALQSLPGVARSPFNSGSLVVRGLPPDATTFGIGGSPLPLVYHFGGLSTVVPGDILSEVRFLPGNYGVRYGRSFGGVVDLIPDPQLPERHTGYVSVDLLQAAVLLSQPLGDRWALTIAGRRSYIDTLLWPVVNQVEGLNLRLPRFADLQVRVQHHWDNGRTGEAMVLVSTDRFSFSQTQPDGDEVESEINVGFARLWMQSRTPMGRLWFRESTLAVGPDRTEGVYDEDDSVYDVANRIHFREEVVRIMPDAGFAGWRMGIDGQLSQESFEYNIESLDSFGYGGEEAGYGDVVRLGFYVEETQKTGDVQVDAGLRVDGMMVVDEYQATAVDPRLSLRWAPPTEWSFNAAMGRYSQFPQLREVLEASGGNPKLDPEYALSSSVGAQRSFGAAWKVEGTAYASLLRDLVSGREDRFVFALAPPPVPPLDTGDYANDGTGRIVGVESLVRYQSDLTQGWVGATWSRSTRVKRPGLERVLFEYDQPLILTAVASRRLPRRFTLGARVRYGSGNPYTPVVGHVWDLDERYWLPVYDDGTTERLPAWFGVDLRVDKDWVFHNWTLTGYLDLQNATNRRNVELMTFSYDYSEELPVYGLPILPAFGLKGAW